MVGKAGTVGNPNFVNRLVLAGHDALNDHLAALFGLAPGAHGDVFTFGAVRRDAGHGRKFPRPCPKAEVGRGQCPHGANVGCVAAPIAVKAGGGVGHDFQFTAAIVEPNDRVARNFGLITGATAALNAPLPVEPNQLAQWHMLLVVDFVVVIEAGCALAMLHGQVLQRALAPFVADGAIKGVAGQQKFDDSFPRHIHGFGGGADNHAIGDAHGATRLQATAVVNFGRTILVL